MTTTAGCTQFLVDRRRLCREIIANLDEITEGHERLGRQALECRGTQDPNLARLAVTLVGGAVRLREIVRDGRALLVRYGRELIENASRIDAAVPQADSAAVAQWKRRLREALEKAGEHAPQVAAHGAPSAPVAAHTPNPFAPLAIPPSGRARAAFEKHCFDRVRELVDFQQTSAFGA